MQEVEDDDRLEDVQLEVALRAGDARSPCRCRSPGRATIVIASACVGLTLPGMIDEPGSFSGRASSPRPLRGPEPSQRRSLAIFIRGSGERRSAPLAITRSSWAASAANLLAAETNGRPVSSAILRRDGLAEAGGRVEPGADRGAADREGAEARRASRSIRAEVGVELGDVAGELLAERERHRVLQVGAADLHDVVELARPWRRARPAARRRSGRAAAGPRAPPRRASPWETCRWTTGDMLTWSFGWIGVLAARACRRRARSRGSRSPRSRSCSSACRSRSATPTAGSGRRACPRSSRRRRARSARRCGRRGACRAPG
mgnify:CR=1 FL=1